VSALAYVPAVDERLPPGLLDDAALARRVAGAARACDCDAEAELCRRLAPRVLLYGQKHLRDGHMAADLVQQVLLTTLQRLRDGALREPERLASFVLGMCRMVVLDLRRTGARRARLLRAFTDEVPAVEVPREPWLDDDKLQRELAALPERERSVLVMTFYDDRPAAQIAAELGLTAGNVRVIRHRALERLRDRLGGEERP
jgi:RNA polymerase sigma-70 factor (ECF subfamily)